MRRFLCGEVLSILVGVLGFIAIYAGSDLLATQRDERKIFRQNPRILLSVPSQDPLMGDARRIQRIAGLFEATVYRRESQGGRGKGVQSLVEDHMAQNPLHVVIGTDVRLDSEGALIQRILKDVSYHRQD